MLRVRLVGDTLSRLAAYPIRVVPEESAWQSRDGWPTFDRWMDACAADVPGEAAHALTDALWATSNHAPARQPSS
jgi:hypothetical protein